MVGAITVLISILAVFLAYNANRGLPFVPTYRVSAQVPNANTLLPGNEVRISGVRVGLVENAEPVPHEDGTVTAMLDLKLDRDVQPLPEDSTVVVRSVSALGLKYLEIRKGTSERGFEPGSVLSLEQARPEPVELDEVLNTADEPTRAAIRANLAEFSAAVAGRGPALNNALGELAPLMRRLQPVMRNISARQTGLGRFVRGLIDIAGEVAPVAEVQAHLFVSLNTTFTALAEVARPHIQRTIEKTPETLDTLTATGPRIRTFLGHTKVLFGELRPGVRALKATAPELADAVVIGAPVLRDAPQLNDELPPTAQSLKNFNDDANSREGIQTLTDTSQELAPTLDFITPAQSVCNYGTLLFRNASSLLSLGDGSTGTWQRFLVFDPPAPGFESATPFEPFQPNNEGTPSTGPANGPQTKNFLHVNPYPNTAAPGQSPRECEAGNESYLPGQQVIGNVPGNQGTVTEGQP
jgi:virulence factor Mce-like protein